MILLIDHNLPPLLARIMHPLAERGGHRVEHVRHRYGDGVADVDYFRGSEMRFDSIRVVSPAEFLTEEH